ncbi:major facilitator superfamily domain-containing protein [Lyophyllum atratum]|nr:major facilitator superfamily domain-containing protein [Lyophyllum atratum]
MADVPTLVEAPTPSKSAELGPADSDSGRDGPLEDWAFPEGGWQAWTTVAGATLVQFATFGYTNAFGVYQDFYVREYLNNYSPSNIGWIGGIQIFLIFTSGIATGRAFDRGYFHHLMIGGAILHSFSFFMLSLSHENKYYQVFLSQGLGGGISVGMMYIPSLAVVSHYFKHNRPLATGIVTSGTALGAVLHPIMINRFFQGSLGFHNGVRVTATLTSGLLLVANCMMRTRLPPKTSRKESMIPKVVEFARDPPYRLIILGGMLIISGFSFPVFFLQLYGTLHGLDSKLSIYIISILNACSIVGRILPPALAPKLGVVNLVIFFTFSMAVLEYCLLLMHDIGGFVAFAVVYGFFSGASVALTPAMLASLAKDVNEVGARIGVSFALSGVIGLFSNSIAGALLTRNFHWMRPIVFAGTTVIAGGICYVAARFLLVRRKGTQFV